MRYNSFNKKNKINDNADNPYRAKNNIIAKTEITDKKAPSNENAPVEETKPKVETGYIAVGVFTALQALPVPGAVVTIYTINQQGEENAIYHLITDENGRVPTVELPVIYNPENPLESSKYYFTTYNMRVQAINYYTVNIIDIRVFPGITTAYRIDMIPAIPGPTKEQPEQKIIIPSSPIDKSNE